MCRDLKIQRDHCLEQVAVENKRIAAWDQDAYLYGELGKAEKERRARVVLRRDLWQRIADEITKHLADKDTDTSTEPAQPDEVLFP